MADFGLMQQMMKGGQMKGMPGAMPQGMPAGMPGGPGTLFYTGSVASSINAVSLRP